MNQILKNVGRRFRSVFKKVDGSNFYGQMLDIPDTSRVSNFLSARRYLRVMPESPIKPTDVVVINGLKYIVAFHGEGFYIDPIYRHMKLFEVDETFGWRTTIEVTDPVTGIKTHTYAPVPVTVYLSTQPRSDIDDRIKIPTEQILAICNAPILVGDLVGPYKATKVDKELGVFIVELKKV